VYLFEQNGYFLSNFFANSSGHPTFLYRRDHVQEHHGGQPGAHEGGDPQRHAQARTRRRPRQLHLVAATARQRSTLFLLGDQPILFNNLVSNGDDHFLRVCFNFMQYHERIKCREYYDKPYFHLQIVNKLTTQKRHI
jgi:hypothetical protein